MKTKKISCRENCAWSIKTCQHNEAKLLIFIISKAWVLISRVGVRSESEKRERTLVSRSGATLQGHLHECKP